MDLFKTPNSITYADLILPVPIPNLFTYYVEGNTSEKLKIGLRVVVEFGSNRIITGIIAKIHRNSPDYETKPILEVLDDTPLITEKQISLFRWIAQYYMANIGDVFLQAFPSGLRVTSESILQTNPEHDIENATISLTPIEEIILEFINKKGHASYQELKKALNKKNIYKYIHSLQEKKAIILFEKLNEKYKPKTINLIRLDPIYFDDQNKMQALFEEFKTAQKQLNAIMYWIKLSKGVNTGVEKKILLEEGASPSSIKSLIDKNIFIQEKQTISRLESLATNTNEEIILSDSQQKAKEKILNTFHEKDIALLHGITGSGKTEIYISLIEAALENGSQVLYLLPEIALTTQIVERLRHYFGDVMGVYHSKYSANERVETWMELLNDKKQLIVGVRSSIFLPFSHLGLVIIDECHETSYKQQSPSPRYHAVDSALVLAKQHNAKVLMGSATPSVEQYYHTNNGNYSLVELNKRYGNSNLPTIEFINTKLEKKKKKMTGSFSHLLLEELKESLNRKEQSIIFQNRRGYSPYLICEDCDKTVQCKRCSVSLTYHMYSNTLICHYCSYKQSIPANCEACGSVKINNIGSGTEKLEEELSIYFPEAKIQRMDLDTTQKKNSLQRIIHDFSTNKIDILVGTQMISKGLDFENVNLVGILDSDRGLHFPDFRSYERTFQIITQVAGRSGRRDKIGKVLVQSNEPEHPIFDKIKSNNFIQLYKEEIQEREHYGYPPFVRIIKIQLKHEDKLMCQRAAHHINNLLATKLSTKRVLGAHEPIVNKVRNLFIMEITVKLERKDINLNKVKTVIYETCMELYKNNEFRKTKIYFDVDPY